MSEIRDVCSSSEFRWHQRGLIRGVQTPGQSDVQFLIEQSRVLEDVKGRSVLDIGTTNGVVAFEAEDRGASRVVALDAVDSGVFGFDRISRALESQVEFVRCNVYELARVLAGEKFDIVIFWGVLYHLRHPLLALDQVRSVSKGMFSCESEVSSASFSGGLGTHCEYFEKDELFQDATNWFSPSPACLHAWLRGAGLDPEREVMRRSPKSTRLLVEGVVSTCEPYYLQHTFEPAFLDVSLRRSKLLGAT